MCPVRGKRALELAKGFIDIVQKKMQRTFASEMSQAVSDIGLDDKDTSDIMTDFDSAKQWLSLSFSTYLRYWQTEPYSLVLLSDPDEMEAKIACRRIIARFSAAPQVEAFHHPLTWLWLGPGLHRRELDRWLETDVSRSELATQVQLEMVSLYFIPIVERHQEGAHAIVKRQVLGRRTSGSTVSLALRRREVEMLLRSSKLTDEFMLCFQALSTPSQIAKAFGFQRHPLWIEAVRLNKQKQNVSFWDCGRAHHVFWQSDGSVDAAYKAQRFEQKGEDIEREGDDSIC